MIVKVQDVASTNKFQQDMSASELAMADKVSYRTDPNNPLNTVDGNSGPAFAFAKLNQSDLEAVGAWSLMPNRTDQAHFEVILWTSCKWSAEDFRTLLIYLQCTRCRRTRLR